MKTSQTQPAFKQANILAASLLLTLCLIAPLAQAESLFQASTTYNAQAPLKSRSLFTPPISRTVGDLVTIQINDTTTQQNNAQLKITRNQVMNQNGAGFYNSMLGFFLNKLPFKTTRINNALQAPNLTGLDNQNTMDSKAEIMHITNFVDNVTCQVVQVLPNGDLMVQGQKTIQANKERTDLIVSGIVRPYYLDRNNQISSRMVGNFQMIQGGKGVISRQQNDGLANKVYQFFN